MSVFSQVSLWCQLCVHQVVHVPEGLQAIIFTADGDMRQALNNLQVVILHISHMHAPRNIGRTHSTHMSRMCTHPLLNILWTEVCVSGSQLCAPLIVFFFCCAGFQATHSGFGLVNQENVFKVCDQPHPLLVAKIIKHCLAGTLLEANEMMMSLCTMGYSAMDIITTVFRVVRNYDMEEFIKLEFIKASLLKCRMSHDSIFCFGGYPYPAPA